MNESLKFDMLLDACKNFNDLFLNFSFKNEKDFLNNQEAIDFSIGVINYVSKLTQQIDEGVLNFISDLADVLIPVVEYSNNLVDKQGYLNTYKLYDFMIIDLPNLIKILENIKYKN